MSFIKYTTGVTNYTVNYMECRCMSTEHLIKFYLDLEEGDLCLAVHLANCLPWYKRLNRAIKYLFGYKRRYDDFDSMVLKEEDLDRLSELISYHKKLKGKESR